MVASYLEHGFNSAFPMKPRREAGVEAKITSNRSSHSLWYSLGNKSYLSAPPVNPTEQEVLRVERVGRVGFFGQGKWLVFGSEYLSSHPEIEFSRVFQKLQYEDENIPLFKNGIMAKKSIIYCIFRLILANVFMRMLRLKLICWTNSYQSECLVGNGKFRMTKGISVMYFKS